MNLTMKRFLRLTMATMLALPSADGMVVLSNEDARVEVSPVGGKVVSFTDTKSGLECVSTPSNEEAPAGTGALADRIKLKRGSKGRELEGSEYQIISRNAKEVVLLLKTPQLNMRKKIALSGKTLTASYELTNPGRRPFTGVFRSCSLLKASEDGGGTLLLPGGTPAADLTAGMMSSGVVFDPKQPKVRNLFVKNPANGKVGWLSGNSAVVLNAPFPVLDKLYVFMPDKSIQPSPQPTVEWYSNEFELKPYSELASYAERHPECANPEDLFVYRFSVSIEMMPSTDAQGRILREIDKRDKDMRFSPEVSDAPVFKEWETKAAPVLAGGHKRLKVLSVNTLDMSNELLEFARRFDCDMRIVEVSNPNVMVNGGKFDFFSWRAPDPAKAFDKALKEQYDVIFMAGVLESALPEGVAAKIIARVKEGAGFVYASQARDFPSLIGSGPKITPTHISYEMLPCELGGAVESKYGKGTVVWVKNRFDACGRYWTRGNAMIPVETRQSQIGESFRDVVFAYFAKLFLHAAGEPCDQDLSAALTATISRCLPRVEMSLKNYRYEAGESVCGSFIAKSGDEAVIILMDGYDRVLARRKQTVRQGVPTDFAISPERQLIQDYAKCRVEVFAGGRVVGRGERAVVLSGPKPGKLNFIIWGNHINYYLERPEVLRRIGFDAITMHLNPGVGYWPDDKVVEERLRAGLRVVPVGMHQIRVWKIKSRERKPCLRDSQYADTVRKDVCRVVDRFEKFRPFMWLSGDENSVGFYDSPHDMCISDPCLTGFRNRLREKFKSVEMLNAAWGTGYRSFEQVVPPTLAEASNGKLAPSWYEHRLYMMDAIPDVLSTMRNELARAYPNARLGVSGQLATRINDCFNWKRALGYLGGSVGYCRSTDILPDMIRSWSDAESPSFGAWAGYTTETNLVCWKLVDEIANGMFSPSYWWSPKLIRRGDGRESADGLAVADTIRMVRESACEEMFAGCEPVAARVAILHSLPSFVASEVVPGDGWLTPSTWMDSLRSWAGVIRDVGYGQPDVVDASDLRKTDLAKYEAIVLPLAVVMSDQESAVLDEYVGRGGKVLYDAFCARYDDRLTARSTKPTFISKKGAAALVPHRLLAYKDYRNNVKKGKFWRDMVGAAFEKVGLKPGYSAHPGFNCRETRDGASRYFLITQVEIDEVGRSSIPLGRSMHIYDTVRHRYLGVNDRIDVTLPSFGSAMFAALPQVATAAKVEFAGKGAEIGCRIHAESDVPRFFRVKLFVDGVERREYARSIRVVGKGGTVFDLGLDGDARGAVVEVLDVLTGEIWKSDIR